MEPNNSTNDTGAVGVSGSDTMRAQGTGESRGAQGDRGINGLVSTARQRVQERVEEGKSQVAESLDAVASTLRRSGSSLRDQQQPGAGGYVDQVASQIERAAGYLQRADTGEMVRGIESFARRQPALFIGAAFAMGVLGARFLRSSRAQLGDDRGFEPVFADREVPTTRASGAADAPVSFDATLDSNGSPT